MRQTIFEAVTGTPRKFWLVLDIPTDKREGNDEWTVNRRNIENKILSDLAQGELEGVRGISASKEIMTDWFVSSRNATLVLDPGDLMALNDIEEVRYDDIDYLSENNFRILYRLFLKEGRNGKLDHQQLMMNVLPYWLKGLALVNPQAAHMLHTYGYGRVADYWEQHHADYKITGHRSAALAIKDMWLKHNAGFNRSRMESIIDDLSDDESVEATKIALRKIGSIYADEAEWIVNSSHLRIPRGSTMLVAVDTKIVAQYDEWKTDQHSDKWKNDGWYMARYERLIEMIKQYRLADFYDLRLVDARRFSGVDLKVARRKRDERLNGVTEGEVVDLRPKLFPDTLRSLTDFLGDPAPLGSKYMVGDVLMLNGEVGEVTKAGDRALVIQFDSARRIVPRNQMGLEPAPLEFWGKK